METAPAAPELSVSRWFNTAEPLTLAGLRGQPVLIHAFQMLCPGCVAHGIPQAEKAYRLFARAGLRVIGLHTVFEHHAAMTAEALEAFIHEYGLTMPIGIDTPGQGTPIPVTMGRYGMQGTPSLVLVGRDGTIQYHGFGQEDDMALGARVSQLLSQPVGSTPA